MEKIVINLETSDESLVCISNQTKAQNVEEKGHQYNCLTCNKEGDEDIAICSHCIKVCHADHEVKYTEHGQFECDCLELKNSCDLLVKKKIDDFSLTVDTSCDIAFLKKEIKTALGLNVDKDQIQFFHYEDNLDLHDERTMLKDILDMNDPTISIEWQSKQEADADVEERGKLLDTIWKPPKVIILSDNERAIMVPKLGRDPYTFFDKLQIDNRELPFQLSSSGWFGKKLYLYIEDPKHANKTEGETQALVYKIPRKTQRVHIRKGLKSKPLSVECAWECDTGMGSEIAQLNNTVVFRNSDNTREGRWQKYVLPVIQVGAEIGGAALG